MALKLSLHISLLFFLTTFIICGQSIQNENLDTNWSNWLIGEWEGWRETENGKIKLKQSFKEILNKKYILTQMEAGEGKTQYKGFGIFWYNANNSAEGHWFGGYYDANTGKAKREGEKMIWNIDRFGSKIVRIRERLSEDEYIVNSIIMNEQGEITKTKEVMIRIKKN